MQTNSANAPVICGIATPSVGDLCFVQLVDEEAIRGAFTDLQSS